MNKQRTLFLAVIVLLLAAVMRLGLIASLPPGMDNDEAFHLLRAGEILRGESLPVYITGNNGNEPLYAYLATLGLVLVGPTAWAGRLISAFVGLLGVALTIRLGLEMFPRRPVGLLAGLVLSTLLWDVTFSRFGSQGILAATAAAGAIAALWRGARTGSLAAYALAGVCLGLGLDAYVAFRLYPLAVMIAGLAIFAAARPDQRRSVLLGGSIAIGATLLVYSPIALFFIQHPEWFFTRFQQTTEGMQQSSSILTNVQRTVGGLFWEGDPDWRFNIAGRPALDLIGSLFFIVGLLALIRRWRKPQSWAVLGSLVVGLVPSMVTIQAPHFGRTTMAIPAVMIILGVGVATAWSLFRRQAIRAVIAGGVATSVLLPVWLYFGVWANDTRVYQSFDVQQSEIARQLKSAPAGTALYATPLNVGWLHDYWAIEYLLGPEGMRRYSAFNGTLCAAVPAVASNGARFVIVAAPEADDWRTAPILNGLYPNIVRTDVSVRGDRFPMAVYDVPAGTAAKISNTARAVFGDIVRLLDVQLAPQVPERGKPMQLSVVWQTLQSSDIPYELFVHLVGAPKSDGSPVYAQYDGEACGGLWHTNSWRASELLFDSYKVRVPANLPAGNYTLEIGWYNQSRGTRLPVVGAGGDSFKLADLTVQ